MSTSTTAAKQNPAERKPPAPPKKHDRTHYLYVAVIVAVVAGILVIRTGGLEAPIAMHVLNNFLAFGLALAFGDLTTALNAEGGSSWWTILSTMTQSLVYLGLATWVARAMGLVDTGPPVGGAPLPPAEDNPVLAAPPPRV